MATDTERQLPRISNLARWMGSCAPRTGDGSAAWASRVISIIVKTEARWQGGPGSGVGGEPTGGSRPVVGISTYSEQAQWGSWDAKALLLPYGYADSVAAAGGIPVLLPPFPGVEHAVARLDAVVLAGGGDIDPAHFGAQAHPETGWIRADRDAAEFALVSAALDRGLPLLGICRGLQVLNVVLGGTLHQHLPDLVGHDEHSPAPGVHGSHQVTVAPGSQLAAILDGPMPDDPVPSDPVPNDSVQPGTFHVPTHHHQSIERLGHGLTATAWAQDGVIEAAELTGVAGNGSRNAHGFVLGVQWHPEAGYDPRLFHALVAAASLAGAAV
jgi:putative glutamine amidotransferase